MQKTLLSAALLLSAMGFYGGDAADAGTMNCSKITAVCRDLGWEFRDDEKKKGKGCDSVKSPDNAISPTEQAALDATAQACNDLINQDKKDPTTACREACHFKLQQPGYCIKGCD